MYFLISFCDLSIWHIMLSWLIPFLIGILLGWLIWGKFRYLYKTAINERDDLQQKVNDLDGKLKECISYKHEQQDVIDILRRQIADASRTPVKLKAEASAAPAAAKVEEAEIFSKINPENLQIIEGIGPKMSEFLHRQGISNWKTLSEYDEEYIKTLLDKEGTKYRIIDPTTWPKQATLADQGKWTELISMQKQLSGGRSKQGQDSDAKIEKVMIRMGLLKKWKQDDLKAVEGIGPKIEKLLYDANIKTWKALASASVSGLTKILEEGGSKFKLADPSTWPEQAEMADQGKWQKLTLLQDRLKGGRKV